MSVLFVFGDKEGFVVQKKYSIIHERWDSHLPNHNIFFKITSSIVNIMCENICGEEYVCLTRPSLSHLCYENGTTLFISKSVCANLVLRITHILPTHVMKNTDKVITRSTNLIYAAPLLYKLLNTYIDHCCLIKDNLIIVIFHQLLSSSFLSVNPSLY